MALSNIEKHYNKHPEDLRLLRRHGIVDHASSASFSKTWHATARYRRGHRTLHLGVDG